LLERLEAEPGVRGVAVASVLPRMEHAVREVEVELDREILRQQVRTARIDPGFFDALDAPILAGRAFTATDPFRQVRPVIVNTAFVNRVLGARNPIGRQLRFVSGPDADMETWHEIVGVVGHLGMSILSPDGGEGVYLPAGPGELHPLLLAVHLGADPEEFTPRLREIVAEVDPLATIDQSISLDQVKPSLEWGLEVLLNGALVVFVTILLSLAASGVYAILSFAVSERAHEIGIRTALGAGREVIVFAVIKRALWQIGLGVFLGTPGVVWLFFQMREYAGLELSDVSTTLAAL
jgi:hypothetical protein